MLKHQAVVLTTSIVVVCGRSYPTIYGDDESFKMHQGKPPAIMLCNRAKFIANYYIIKLTAY